MIPSSTSIKSLTFDTLLRHCGKHFWKQIQIKFLHLRVGCGGESRKDRGKGIEQGEKEENEEEEKEEKEKTLI